MRSMQMTSPYAAAPVLPAVTLLATICVAMISVPARAQYIEFMVPDDESRTWHRVEPGDFEAQRDDIVLCIYSGGTPWLLEQQDPRSRLHELPNLAHVALVQHDISREELAYVTRLKNVESVWIGQAPEGVTLPGESLDLLTSMPKLWQLQLCIHGLDEAHLKFLTKCQRLTHLRIEPANEWQHSQDPIPYAKVRVGEPSDACAHHIAATRTLETLELPMCRWLTDEFIEKIAKLPKLRSLTIESPLLTDESLRIIAEQMRLENLDLSAQNLTDEGAARWLSQAKTLRELRLESPQLSEKAFDATESLDLQSIIINGAQRKRGHGDESRKPRPAEKHKPRHAEPGVGAASR